MDDLISRQAAIDALNKEIIKRRLLDDVNDGMLDEFDTETILKKLPSAQPEQKNGKKFIEIVTEYPAICTYPEYEGKPYFSIRYEENGEKIEGFGTYNLEVLSKYIREYFMGEKKGKWIKVEKLFHTRFHSDQPDTYHEYRCTVCLKTSDKATNYCPNCGSKMEE